MDTEFQSLKAVTFSNQLFLPIPFYIYVLLDIYLYIHIKHHKTQSSVLGLEQKNKKIRHHQGNQTRG